MSRYLNRSSQPNWDDSEYLPTDSSAQGYSYHLFTDHDSRSSSPSSTLSASTTSNHFTRDFPSPTPFLPSTVLDTPSTPITQLLLSLHVPSQASSGVSPVRKRSKNGPKSSGHIPRPPNAFMLYRSYYCSRGAGDGNGGSVISQQAGEEWKKVSKAEREKWIRRACQIKKAHALAHPHYVFKPGRVKTQRSATGTEPARKAVRQSAPYRKVSAVSSHPPPSSTYCTKRTQQQKNVAQGAMPLCVASAPLRLTNVWDAASLSPLSTASTASCDVLLTPTNLDFTFTSDNIIYDEEPIIPSLSTFDTNQLEFAPHEPSLLFSMDAPPSRSLLVEPPVVPRPTLPRERGSKWSLMDFVLDIAVQQWKDTTPAGNMHLANSFAMPQENLRLGNDPDPFGIIFEQDFGTVSREQANHWCSHMLT